METLEQEVAKPWERQTREMLDSYEQAAARRLGQKIDPDKWCGTCYGRDLESEIGKHYE